MSFTATPPSRVVRCANHYANSAFLKKEALSVHGIMHLANSSQGTYLWPTLLFVYVFLGCILSQVGVMASAPYHYHSARRCCRKGHRFNLLPWMCFTTDLNDVHESDYK